MFASAGVDAAAAPAALTKALKKVKSPAELQTLIDQISATEDPFKRAQLASDLFGAKAGPKLAQALAQGTIGDFRVSLDEAAGATTKAADTIQSGFGNQAQLVIKNFGGALAEIGTNFGPLILGFSALLPALTPIITTAGTALGGLLAAAVPIGMALLPVILIGALVAAVAFLIANPEIVGKIAEFVGSILAAIGDFLGTLGEVFATAFGAAVDAVAGAVGQIVGFIGEIPGRVAGFFLALVQQWVDAAGPGRLDRRSSSSARSSASSSRSRARSSASSARSSAQFATLGGQIIGIVTGFIGSGRRLLPRAPGRIAGLVGTIAGFFVDLGGRIVSTVSTVRRPGRRLLPRDPGQGDRDRRGDRRRDHPRDGLAPGPAPRRGHQRLPLDQDRHRAVPHQLGRGHDRPPQDRAAVVRGRQPVHPAGHDRDWSTRAR